MAGRLRAAEKQQSEWDVVQAALELEFPPEEAEKQLETAINWGRYTEVVSCDDGSEVLTLEPTAVTPSRPSG